ncbi:MAG: NAD(P)H-dependent oxidoreductase [Devosia sp.]|uniref:NADPH-dependent FMN reductase n=1 Tax=Devosia sp. TaxID=1871048 RepID=UPI001AD498C8|nr:NAD(P)H-dependent oxidoreductase [Devosia sp.]MBN9307808.1 NAD(P)H-dependent oxidoreductase [Devosia sp.]MBN9314691.1 NAD(P)H-dependent oxidoreductase [Devosia sp.]
MYRVAVFIGSTRPTSSNLKLAKALEKLAAGKLEFDYVQIDNLPFYDDALWNDPPAEVIRLKREISDADAVLFVTPEYNRSIPGILKNAIDWPSRPFGESVWTDKPGAIAGATGGVSGTAAAQMHLRSILPVVGVALMGRPEVYFQSRPGAIDDAFNITDEKLRSNLLIWVDQFSKWIGRFAEPRAAESTPVMIAGAA